MKKVRTAILTFGLVTSALMSVSVSAAPDDGSYYLICRGGGDMNPIIKPMGASAQIIVDFKGANEGWQKSPSLSPGHCTWIDRAVSLDEPHEIRLNIPADVELTKSWGPNLKAFILPLAPPIQQNIRRKTRGVAIQVMHEPDGFSLKVLRSLVSEGLPAPRTERTRRTGPAYEVLATFDFSSRSYLTFSVKNIDGALVGNRLIKGVVTGDEINIDSGGEVKVAPPPAQPRSR